MVFTPSDPATLVAFVLLAIAMLAVIVRVLQKAAAPASVIVGFLLYLGALAALTLSGVARAHVIPIAPLIAGTTLVGAVWLAASRLGGRIAARYSLAALIGIQGVRLLLELVLHRWAATGTVPTTMTWTGQNVDVIAGAVSLVAIPWLDRSRALAWAVQLIGVVLLVNVLRVVVMSSPFPFAWPLAQPLQLPLYFPYVLIVPLFVGTAVTAHVIAFRKLLGRAAAGG